MRFRGDLSTEAQNQLARFAPDVRERIGRAIDEFETKDDSRWSKIKALQGPKNKGRLRKRVGPYRIIFRKYPQRGEVEVSAIFIKSKDTYR
jgi:mRNA-degrading endonuclease RelE of RelBE toxin-antitoxin system